MGKYFDELMRSIEYISEQDNSIFLGQAVAVAGTAMSNTLANVQHEKLLELPVEEDFQLGISIGLSLHGFIPISIFPRWNFLLLATNQIVNHLDKLKALAGSDQKSKVIIRTGIGSINPLHPGPQHTGDFTDAFRIMCPNLEIIRLDNSSQIFSSYQKAFERNDGVSSILIEWSDKYND